MRGRPSIERRLLTVAVLSGLACIGALIVLMVFARTTFAEKRAAAHHATQKEVAHLYETYAEAPAAETRHLGIRHFGDLQSGFLRSDFQDEWGASRFYPAFYKARTKAANASKERGAVDVEEAAAPDGGRFVIAVRALPDEGYVWAADKIQLQPNVTRLRMAALGLGAASLVLVIASLHTLSQLRRGILTILGSLRRLKTDLSADVDAPAMAELKTISDGVTTLAHGLRDAQSERDQLMAELAAKERLAALGRVVAGVAHEVRNPLAAMKLRVDMAIEAGDIGPRHERELLVVATEIGRLDRLVCDLLLAAGPKSIVREESDLGAFVRERAQLLRPWAADHGVQLVASGAVSANIDRDAMARLVDNLARNAVEAAPEGSVVEIIVTTGDEGRLRIQVFDEGDGIPVERAAELFEPFFTLKPKGTGLGLAISRAIAVAHGGILRYRREGERTCFEVVFDAVPSPA